jgi:hypothetical protein
MFVSRISTCTPRTSFEVLQKSITFFIRTVSKLSSKSFQVFTALLFKNLLQPLEFGFIHFFNALVQFFFNGHGFTFSRVTVRVLIYPTLPSISSSIKRFNSTAYSSGNSLAMGSMNPRTIKPVAASSLRPRDIR